MYYKTVYILLVIFCKIVFRYRVYGRENIPRQGGFILAANHMSYLDPVVVALAGAPRELNFMAKESLFKVPVLKWILKSLNTFPVKRGIADKAAISKAIRLLSQGEPLVIYPEGTRMRDGRLGEAMPGVAMIALKTGVPIVPVGIIGTDKVLPDGHRIPRLRKLVARIGEPITVEKAAAGERREKEAELSKRMMADIGRLIAED